MPKDSAAKHRPKTWTRSDPLGETPKRVTDAYPLSDQRNQAGWVKFEPLSDEFEGKELDQKEMVAEHEVVEGAAAGPVQPPQCRGRRRQADLDHAEGEAPAGGSQAGLP